jgi:hypothetical protein
VTCEEIRELLPAYALGLLDADEIAAVEAHLAECREHDAELVDLRATGFALDLLRDDVEVSPGLAERVAGIPTAAPDPPVTLVAPPASKPRWWLAAAAVVALFAVFGGGWLAHAAFEDTDAPPAAIELRYALALHGADGEFVRFSGIEGDDEVTVVMSGLERLSGGQLYRLWAIRDGEWLPIGQCNTNAEGGWVGDFVFSLTPADQLVVTVEAPSADPQPRAEPILSSQS